MSQTFGRYLRHLRRRNGMTQNDLAERLGYSRSMVAALETDRRLPDVDAVADLYVSALQLPDSRDEATQLVNLAASARDASRLLAHKEAFSHPRVSTEETSTAFRVVSPSVRLFGREREVHALCDRFLYGDERLITLVGPPGVGKTSQAQAVAARLQSYFADGAAFVSLATLTNPENVASEILATLNAGQNSGTSYPRLVSLLRRKQLLLVLDNFEQLLSAAPLVAHLLDECASLRVLTTSRERLHLRAEHVVHVLPLALDAAVELFVERATAVQSNLPMSDDDQKAIAHICERLDCLPLAIELCAVQVDYYPLQELQARVDSRALDTLVDGPSDLPVRHQTLRATIQGSYDLLGRDEKGLFQALAVFAGGFTRDMAMGIWQALPHGDDRPFESVMRALIGKSLVNFVTTANGSQRLAILESLREFARERLVAEGALEEARQRHFLVTRHFVLLGESKLFTPECPVWQKAMLREWENVNAALQWLYEKERWEEFASLTTLANTAFEDSVRHTEVGEWYERLMPNIHHLDACMALVSKITFCYHAHGDRLRPLRQAILGEYQTMIEACEDPLIKSLALFLGHDIGVEYADPIQALRDAVELARAGKTTQSMLERYGVGYNRDLILFESYFRLGCYLANRGEAIESITNLEESIALGTEIGCIYKTHWGLGYLGRVELWQGRTASAIEKATSAVASAEAVGETRGMVCWRAFLGQAYLCANRPLDAQRELERSWKEGSLFADPFAMQIAALFLAELAFHGREIDVARHWLVEAISLSARSSRDLAWRHIHRALLAARLAAAEGRDERAAQLYGFMQAYDERWRIGPTGPVIDTAIADMARVRQRLGDEPYRRAYDAGRLLPVEETLASLLA